ncbi:hypothetical protein JCM33374_g962 [Metschnikowia sp. JCM 33374]|nr:hypothetical protein JCM33374_g962 [Metschnikowia sp. JCM 33374]
MAPIPKYSCVQVSVTRAKSSVYHLGSSSTVVYTQPSIRLSIGHFWKGKAILSIPTLLRPHWDEVKKISNTPRYIKSARERSTHNQDPRLDKPSPPTVI